MEREKLVEEYISAWNRQDVAGILNLMHEGAAIFDAFWMETCVGKDIPKYVQDGIDEQNHWYQKIGEVIFVDNGVAFHYSAHEQTDSTIGPAIYEGAEVLIVLDEKILTVSDYYCNPDRTALKEVAQEVAGKRHGVPSYTKSGLGALRMLRVKAKLSTTIAQDKAYLDPNLTLSRLADKIGCPIDDLSQIIEGHFGTDYQSFLDNQRIEHAKVLLQEESDDPNILTRVAAQAGFKSFEEFSDKFTDYFGVTPSEFCRDHNKKDNSVDNSKFH